MRNLTLMAIILGAQISLAQAIPNLTLTMGTDALDTLVFDGDVDIDILERYSDISVVEIPAHQVYQLSSDMHTHMKRCGGFAVHDDYFQALTAVEMSGRPSFSFAMFNYTIDRADDVEPMIKMVSDQNIEKTILKLSSFHNRFYKSKTGVQSSNWIHDHWSEISSHRTDVKVEKFVHRKWPQPTIIMTIEGSVNPEEVVVIGGHADSIAGQWNAQNKRAPGADDNASGIASITEVIQVAMLLDYRPSKTVKFMAYAAEEVGLLGSAEVAKLHKKNKADVIGVLQLDMTGFNGSANDIVMMSDFTNADQNEFIGSLIDTYLPGLSWGYSKCGYGCSDHASWHRQGYPASIPFEANMNEMNRKIHTARDTLESLGGDATHSAKFSQLAIAYMVEMAK